MLPARGMRERASQSNDGERCGNGGGGDRRDKVRQRVAMWCARGGKGWFVDLFTTGFGWVLVGFHTLFPERGRKGGAGEKREIFCVRFAGQPH